MVLAPKLKVLQKSLHVSNAAILCMYRLGKFLLSCQEGCWSSDMIDLI